jgi:hypothetical protein
MEVAPPIVCEERVVGSIPHNIILDIVGWVPAPHDVHSIRLMFSLRMGPSPRECDRSRLVFGKRLPWDIVFHSGEYTDNDSQTSLGRVRPCLRAKPVRPHQSPFSGFYFSVGLKHTTLVGIDPPRVVLPPAKAATITRHPRYPLIVVLLVGTPCLTAIFVALHSPRQSMFVSQSESLV